jgi:hypothetical protein
MFLPSSIARRLRADRGARRGRGFAGNPYLFLGPRPFREARLRSYILGQHRAGRPLAEIMADAYVRRCGSERLCWRVLQDASTLAALERDVRETIEKCVP